VQESAPGGYFGKALIVDLDTADGDVKPLEEEVLRSYIGGAGLGTWLMHECCPPGVDPLAPAAPLIFVFSPLVGTPLTTSAKFAVVAKSPLTGRLTDALASSHFAIAGKLTGHDAIVLRGAFTRPQVLLIDGGTISVAPAEDLWGLPAAETEQELRERMGPAWRVAAIGPAGERLVRYATISHDGRHAGRGGLGAVMGSKLCKAIMVRARQGRLGAPGRRPGCGKGAARALVRACDGQVPRARDDGQPAGLQRYFNIADAQLLRRDLPWSAFAGAEEIAELRQVARSSCASESACRPDRGASSIRCAV
jgi:aldehyde:ferredoxin oxidoreductase